MAYDHGCDSNYEDDEDGWSVVGGDRQCAVWADRAKSADKAGAMGGGRYELLVGAEMQIDEQDDDGFLECDCDNADFRFEIRKERRVRQQERRKQNGQQRKGRTARKRVAAVAAATPGVPPAVHKRICWLRAKLNRAGVMWQAAIAHARTCYGAQDGCAWVQLEEQMQMARAEDERFWRDAVEKLRSGEVSYCFGEEMQMEQVLTQIEKFRGVAADGKGSRFKAEKWATWCQAAREDRGITGTYDESMRIYAWRAMMRRNRRELLGRRPIDDSSSDYDC